MASGVSLLPVSIYYVSFIPHNTSTAALQAIEWEGIASKYKAKTNVRLFYSKEEGFYQRSCMGT